MRALVVYESMFGNTEEIARAVGRGMAESMTVDVVEVGAADPEPGDIDVLVVGGPTHAFGMSRASTRADAASRTAQEVISRRTGVREWLDALGRRPDSRAAAFDTRVSSRIPGSAAKAMARRLRRLGYRLIAPATSFWVADMSGPLREGEIGRAEDWGRRIAAHVVTHARR